MDSTVYTNRSYHLGINQRSHGRLLDDNECMDLRNADISVPGVRTKRLEPTVVTTLTVPASGIFQICQLSPYDTDTPTLFWSAAGGVTAFRVQIFAETACGGAIINDSGLLPVSVFSYTVPTGVFTVINHFYSWKVIAYGDGVDTPDVESGCCPIRVSTAPCITLAAPTITFPDTNPYTFTTNPVTINWTNVVNAVGYIVHFYQGATEVHTSPLLPQGTFAYLTNLLVGGTYNVTVQAIGDGTIYCDSAESTTIEVVIACSYSLDPTSASHTVFAGLGLFHVETGPDCSWTASSNSAWITLPGITSGTGPGDVAYLYECNPELTGRTGSVTAAGLTFTVNQDGPVLSLVPDNATFDSGGGSDTFTVDSNAPCTAWTAVSNDGWITVDSGTPGTGDGTVGYTVDPNTGAARTGTITAAGLTFTVNQGALFGVDVPGLIPRAIKVNLSTNRAYILASSISGSSFSNYVIVWNISTGAIVGAYFLPSISTDSLLNLIEASGLLYANGSYNSVSSAIVWDATSVPPDPVFLGSVSGANIGFGGLTNGYVTANKYVKYSEGGIEVVDVSNPASPGAPAFGPDTLGTGSKGRQTILQGSSIFCLTNVQPVLNRVPNVVLRFTSGYVFDTGWGSGGNPYTIVNGDGDGAGACDMIYTHGRLLVGHGRWSAPQYVSLSVINPTTGAYITLEHDTALTVLPSAMAAFGDVLAMTDPTTGSTTKYLSVWDISTIDLPVAQTPVSYTVSSNNSLSAATGIAMLSATKALVVGGRTGYGGFIQEVNL